MSHIFISYSHEDKAYALKLFRYLRDKNFNPWVYERIEHGAAWKREIERRVKTCSAFIVIMTPSAYNSDYVQGELELAKETNKTILPLLLEGDIWWDLRSKQAISVVGGKIPLPDEFLIRLAKVVSLDIDEMPVSKEMPVPRKVDPPAEEHLENKKLSIQVIIAIVGAVATILAAVLGSLPWGEWLAPADETPYVTVTSQVTVTLPTFTPTPTLGIGSSIESGGVTMMYVPAGEFKMGSEKQDAEKPIHSVTLDAYWIDKYEVTNAAYKRCVDAGVCDAPKRTSSSSRSSYYGNSEFDEYPVIYVDWNMANEYCAWRDARLPTEAEWEKAVRGLDGRTYPWGEDINCDKLNYSGCKGDTTKVGSYLDGISSYGLYDMVGNVWEWVNDWYDSGYYQSSPSSNPMGPASGSYRVLRGGSWNDYDYYVRSALRNLSEPNVIYYNVGFRCARSQ